MEQRDKIDVLLKEYDSLRGECLQRGAAGFALITATVATVTWFLSNWHGCKSVLPASVLGSFLSFSLLLNWRATKHCAARIRQIEIYINDVANEYLLVWESFWAAGKRGLFHEIYNIKPPSIPKWAKNSSEVE